VLSLITFIVVYSIDSAEVISLNAFIVVYYTNSLEVTISSIETTRDTTILYIRTRIINPIDSPVDVRDSYFRIPIDSALFYRLPSSAFLLYKYRY
jgi:hypothetical protein